MSVCKSVRRYYTHCAEATKLWRAIQAANLPAKTFKNYYPGPEKKKKEKKEKQKKEEKKNKKGAYEKIIIGYCYPKSSRLLFFSLSSSLLSSSQIEKQAKHISINQRPNICSFSKMVSLFFRFATDTPI